MADRTFGMPLCVIVTVGPRIGHFHAVPVQYRIRVLGWAMPELPTAHALWVEVAATLDRPLLGGLGLGTFFQVLPFQCAITVLLSGRVPRAPTAQALVAEVAATPAKKL